jgi:hypothetical protein
MNAVSGSSQPNSINFFAASAGDAAVAKDSKKADKSKQQRTQHR